MLLPGSTGIREIWVFLMASFLMFFRFLNLWNELLTFLLKRYILKTLKIVTDTIFTTILQNTK